MRYTTRPLTDEARLRLQGIRREGSPFSGSWSDTLEILERELMHLGVRSEYVIQIDVQESDLRLDGELRANARPMSPAVAISIKSNKGDLLFVCGKFPNWQHNVRAIALGLEALRKVKRYGIVQSDEQYRGWQALPPGTPMPAAKMTAEEAAAFIARASWPNENDDYQARWAHRLINEPELRESEFRRAAKNLHPDAGGDADQFRKLTEARDLLDDL